MPPRPFLTQNWGVLNCLLSTSNSHSHSHPPQNPPKNVNQEKLTEINISQEQRKKRGREIREPSPQEAARVGGGQTGTPPAALLGTKGSLHVAPELGVRCDSPLNIHGDLDERCRAGQGLGVSLLRLWPGEWLSPRWPLREPRSLLCWSRGAGWGEGRRRSTGE